MAVAIYENIQNIALMSPALGYGVNLLISWFGNAKNKTAQPLAKKTVAVQNYEAAVNRLKKQNPKFVPAFTQAQIESVGYQDYASTLSVLSNPNQHAADRLRNNNR